MMRLLSAYGFISGLCALLNVIIVVAGDKLGLGLFLSVCLSFVVCAVIGYVLHSRFTFRRAARLQGFFRYTAAMSANFPLYFVGIWLFRDVLGLPVTIAAVLATLSLTAYNFLSSRWAIIKGPMR